MNCEEIREKLTDYPDGIIDTDERESIKNHLAVCPNCREELEALAKAYAEVCLSMETTVAGASLSPNMWAVIKMKLDQKGRRRIPTFASIKSKVAGWGRKFWARPVWQRAVSVAVVAALTAALVVTQLVVGLPPLGVIARASQAAAKVDSYHVSVISTDSRNSDVRRQETDYVAPDRRNIVNYVNDIKTSERRSIGDHHYSRHTETGEWRLSINAWQPQPVAQMSEFLATLGDFTDTEVLADEVIGGVVCMHHKASFYSYELLVMVMKRELENETDPDMITEIEGEIEDVEKKIAEGDKDDFLVFEFWIGKDDYLLRKLDQTIERELSGETFTETATATYSNFNEPIEIAAPVGGEATSAYLQNPDISVLSRIVCVSEKDGNEEIYVMNADGTGLTRLTDNEASDRDPLWSPDGSKIAFISGREGTDDIYVMDADGSNQTRLTDGHDGRISPEWLKWSPDGSKIAYWYWGVRLMNADGSDNIALEVDDMEVNDMAWSPDGTKIACIARWGIYTMNADGFDNVKLLKYDNMNGNDFYSTWSPDGSKIAFCYPANVGRDSDAWEIRVMDADGTNLTTVAEDVDHPRRLSWSPDSSKLLFADVNNRILIMNADGTDETLVAVARNPIWNADGTKIIYESSGQNIWMVDADGTNMVNLTADLGVE